MQTPEPSIVSGYKNKTTTNHLLNMQTLTVENQDYFLPENPDELTTLQFVKIAKILRENELGYLSKRMVFNITAIATGIDINFLLDAPAAFFNDIHEITKWVFSINLESYTMQDYIEIEGERYTYQKDKNVSNREWIDLETIVTTFPEEDKSAAILGVRLRKQLKNEAGDYLDKIEPYNTDMLEINKDKFNNLPISKVAPLIAFFLSSERLSSLNSNLYSALLSTALVNHQHLLDWQSNSDGYKQSSNWRKKIYSKWMKFLTNQLKTHVHYSLTLSSKIKH